MRFVRSRLALVLTGAAALAMTATPVLARGYGGYDGWGRSYGPRHHHHGDGIDGGDLLAGLLIVGGVAAIASAVTKSSRERTASAPPPLSREDGRYDDAGAGYDRRAAPAPVGTQDRLGGHFDDAAGLCADEIEKGDRHIGNVDAVTRNADRYSVTGRLTDGRGFACSIDDEGHVRSVAVDGHGVI